MHERSPAGPRAPGPPRPLIVCDAQSTADLPSDVETIPGAIGYAQTGDAATAGSGTMQSVALTDFPDLSEISVA